MTMIEVRGLTKRFGLEKVVDDLSFTVEAGQVTGFLGPNGAGKTTPHRRVGEVLARTGMESMELTHCSVEYQGASA